MSHAEAVRQVCSTILDIRRTLDGVYMKKVGFDSTEIVSALDSLKSIATTLKSQQLHDVHEVFDKATDDLTYAEDVIDDIVTKIVNLEGDLKTLANYLDEIEGTSQRVR